jgi:3-hydroxybutyryl-CoA dehydratase
MNDQYGYDVEELQEGITPSFAETLAKTDMVLFTGVSAANNAMHTNEEFAATTAFQGRIARAYLRPAQIARPDTAAVYLP